MLVLLARSCSGSSAKSANENYVDDLTEQVLKPSDNVAKAFHETLELRAASLAQLQGRIDAELKSMQQVRSSGGGAQADQAARALSARTAADALQFRVTGLQLLLAERLATAWKRVKRRSRPGSSSTTCMGQLLSSDYVYADLFADGANGALKQVGAAGRADVAVPRARPTSTW